MATREELEQKAARVVAALVQPTPMRRGVVGERYMKCGKPTCSCRQEGGVRHGPYFTLTRGVGGTTRSKYLTAAQAAEARRQVEAGREFRRQVEVYWQVCEQWADAELEAHGANSATTEKKGGSEKPSTRKSSPRSRR